MGPTITLDWDQMDHVTLETLISARENIERNNFYGSVDVWDAMGEVIAYFSTKSQLEEFEKREIPLDWQKTVVEHTLDRLKNRSVKLYLDFA